MSYRIDFVDATGMARLVAVEDTRHDALVVTEEVTAAVPDAASHLTTVEDPLLGLETRVIQPPANYDTNAGLPVLSLSGVIDPANDWQARVVAALTDPPVVILDPRPRQPDLDEHPIVRVSRRRQFLLVADTQLFWFDGRPDPEAFLELGVYLGSGKVVVGASPSLPDRAVLAAQVSDGHPDIVLHDSLELVIEVARADLRECAPKRLRFRGFFDDPDVAAVALSEALYELAPGPSLVWQLPELVALTAHAGGQGIAPVLLTRIYLVAERLRLDGTDPLAWTELHEAVDVLRRDYGPLPGFDYGPLSGLDDDELDDEM